MPDPTLPQIPPQELAERLDRGEPLQVLDVRDERARNVYGFDLLLLRPDMHVVWRGNDAPREPVKLAALATGH